MSRASDVNICDNSSLIRNDSFVTAFAVGWFDAHSINRMPDIDAADGEFDSLDSHSPALRFNVDLKRKNTALFREQVSEMRSRDFAVKLIEKIREFSDAVLLFIDDCDRIRIGVISTYNFLCALRGVIFFVLQCGFCWR